MLRIAGLALALLAQVAMAAAPKHWVLSPTGFGPLRIGMSLQQVSATVGERFYMPFDDNACFYVAPKANPGLALMIVDGRLKRIDLRGPSLRTSTGLAVGDSVAKVKATYGNSLLVEPHHYAPDEEQYLTAFGASRRYAIRFETNEGKVGLIYGGFYEQVQYVEGCA